MPALGPDEQRHTATSEGMIAGRAYEPVRRAHGSDAIDTHVTNGHHVDVGAASRRRLEPEVRRQELMAALAAELAETDWYGITAPMVVRRADASQGLFYCYVSDLDAAFSALVDERVVPRPAQAAERFRLDVDTPEAVEAILASRYEGSGQVRGRWAGTGQGGALGRAVWIGGAADYCRQPLEDVRARSHVLREDGTGTGTGTCRQVDATLFSRMVEGMAVGCASPGLGDADPACWAREMARCAAFGLPCRDDREQEHQ